MAATATPTSLRLVFPATLARHGLCLARLGVVFLLARLAHAVFQDLVLAAQLATLLGLRDARRDGNKGSIQNKTEERAFWLPASLPFALIGFEPLAAYLAARMAVLAPLARRRSVATRSLILGHVPSTPVDRLW